jgi:hypothetical protein
MATVSKYASYHTAITTGYTNPSNAYADDGVYATAAPAKSAQVSAYFGFAGFTTGEIPDNSIINSVTIEFKYKVSTTASIATQYWQVFNGTTGLGTEQSDASEPLTDTIKTHQVTSGVTLSDLRSNDTVRARLRSARGNSNTAVTFYIDYVKITVNFNAPPSVTLNSPDNNATITDTTPSFTFTGTDPDSDELEYEVQVDKDSALWYDESWLYRIKLTVLATKVGGNLTNFPVYVNLNDLPTHFHANVNQTDARDIRVTKADGITELPREVVFYDSTNDKGELHFKADSLSPTTDTDFYIYYGNSNATEPAANSTYGHENVWNSNYKLVAHLNETSGTQHDSTSSHSDFTTVNVTAQGSAMGQIDGGDNLSKPNSNYLLAGTNSNLYTPTNQTLSVWASLTSVPTNDWEYHLIDRDNPTGTRGYHMGFFRDSSTNKTVIRYNLNNGTWKEGNDSCLSTVDIPTGTTLHHIVCVHDANATTRMKIYVDGVLVGTQNLSTGTIGDSNVGVAVGLRGEEYIDCIVDEVRILNTPLPAEWISTEYNNQSSPSTFYSVGAQQTYGNFLDVLSSTDNTANWTGTGDPHPWPSGNQVTYTVPSGSELSSGTYYWRVRAKDPSGSNTWGAWSETRSFTIQAGTTTSDNRSAHTKGFATTSNTRNARVKGSLTTSDNRNAKTKGAIFASDNRSARTKGVATTSDTRNARIKGSITTSDNRNAHSKGLATTSDTRGARTKGLDTATDTRNARTKGITTLTTSDTRGARTKGMVTASDTRLARTKGFATLSDTRLARIKGIETISDTRNARTKGIAVATDNRSARTKGVATTSDTRSARTKGFLTTSDTRSARTKGVATVSDTRNAKTKGVTTASDFRSAKTSGFTATTITDTRNARISGCIVTQNIEIADYNPIVDPYNSNLPYNESRTYNEDSGETVQTSLLLYILESESKSETITQSFAASISDTQILNETISIGNILSLLEQESKTETLSLTSGVSLTEAEQETESLSLYFAVSLLEQKMELEQVSLTALRNIIENKVDNDLVGIGKIINLIENLSYQELLSILAELGITETAVFTEDVLTKFKEFLIKAFARSITKYPQILLPNVRADISSIPMPTLLSSTPYNENLPYNDSNDGYNGLYEYHKLQSDTVVKSQKIRPFVKIQKVSYN